MVVYSWARAGAVGCLALLGSSGLVAADDGRPEEGLQAAAYDILLVPRQGRATRSRLWTERGWVTLPDRSQRYGNHWSDRRDWRQPRAQRRPYWSEDRWRGDRRDMRAWNDAGRWPRY